MQQKLQVKKAGRKHIICQYILESEIEELEEKVNDLESQIQDLKDKLTDYE